MATREITVNGNTYNDGPYDPVTNTRGLANGGHRQNNNLINMLLDVLADASVPLLDGSTTSMTIGTGTKTPTLEDNRPIPEGSDVKIIDRANAANWMFGNVTDHTDAVLTVNVTLTNGSGTIADWIIQPTSPRGPTGAAGASYDNGSVFTPGYPVQFADNEARRPKLLDYAFTHQALGSINSNTAINLENGNSVSATIGGALTFSFTNPPATGSTGEFLLELTNGGAYTVTWPAAVKWPGGVAPSLQSSGVDVLSFYTRDGGTTWRGKLTDMASA